MPAPVQAASPPATADGTKVLDNPNNTLPPNLDPNQPYGPPVVRTDWVISASASRSFTGMPKLRLVQAQPFRSCQPDPQVLLQGSRPQ